MSPLHYEMVEGTGEVELACSGGDGGGGISLRGISSMQLSPIFRTFIG